MEIFTLLSQFFVPNDDVLHLVEYLGVLLEELAVLLAQEIMVGFKDLVQLFSLRAILLFPQLVSLRQHIEHALEHLEGAVPDQGEDLPLLLAAPRKGLDDLPQGIVQDCLLVL